LRYRDHIGWNSSKIISRLIVADPTSQIYSKRSPEVFAGIGVGYGKCGIRHTEAVISLKRGKD